MKNRQEWLETALESISDGLIVTDEHGTIVFLNTVAEAITGWDRQAVLGQDAAALLRLVREGQGAAAVTAEHPVAKTLRTGDRTDLGDRTRLVTARGTTVPIGATTTAIRDEQGVVAGCIFVFSDITARRRDEALRDGQNQLLELISTDVSLAEVLARLCRLVESQHEGMLCSVLLLEKDGVHVRHGAAPSLPDSYVKAVDGASIGPRAGSCGTAMYLRKPVVVTDVLHDPLWEDVDHRTLAVTHGLRACWSTPIMSRDGTVLGSFAMYYRTVRSPSPGETRLIEAAAHMAGIAIERKLAEEALRDNEAFYRMLIENANDLISVIDAEGRFSYVSQTRPTMLGYRASDMVGSSAFTLAPPEDSDRLKRDLTRVLGGEPVVETYRARRVDGSWRWLEAALQRVWYKGAPHVLSVTRDVTERWWAEQRLELQYAVARVLAESASLVDAAPRILQELCDRLDWNLGEYWRLDPDTHQLQHLESWHVPELACEDFIADSRQMMFGPDNGLPGRSRQDGQVAWIPDLARDPTFLRSAAAARFGLQSAVAVPVRLALDVVGVIVLFSQDRRQPDRALVEVMATIGSQIGQFVERKRAEEARDRLRAGLETERLRVFQATMRTVHDIVNNFLETCQVVRLEAEGRLPPKFLAQFDLLIRDTAGKLRTLADLQTVREKEMAIGIGIDYQTSEHTDPSKPREPSKQSQSSGQTQSSSEPSGQNEPSGQKAP